MFEKTIESIINDLIQLDVDACYSYSEAIKEVEEKDIQQQLINFQKDHERHIEELSTLLKDMGGEPIKPTRDFKGFIIEGMTALQSLTGTKGALKAMLTNEKITNKKYADALEYKGFNQEVRKLIQENFNDERRHLEYVKEKISEIEGEEGA
jgi:rubrerythrin